MKIDAKTKWQEVEPIYAILKDADIEALKDTALRLHGVNGDFYTLTIEQFLTISGGDLKAFNLRGDGTAYERIFIDELQAFLRDYINRLTSYSVPQTSDEQIAGKVCMEVTTGEGLLIFARSYFGLKSFEEAGKLTLAELLIAKKDNYNNIVYQRELQRLQTRKFKK